MKSLTFLWYWPNPWEICKRKVSVCCKTFFLDSKWSFKENRLNLMAMQCGRKRESLFLGIDFERPFRRDYSAVFWRKVILMIFVIFELGPDSKSLCNALPSESISCEIRALIHPKKKIQKIASEALGLKMRKVMMVQKNTFIFVLGETSQWCCCYFKSAPWWLFSKTKWQIY